MLNSNPESKHFNEIRGPFSPIPEQRLESVKCFVGGSQLGSYANTVQVLKELIYSLSFIQKLVIQASADLNLRKRDNTES